MSTTVVNFRRAVADALGMSWIDVLLSMVAGERSGPKVARAQRFATQGFTCMLGEILDLSASGMKVQCARKPELDRGKVLGMTVSSAFQRVSVQARVAWVSAAPAGIGWHIGLQFVNLPRAAATAIEAMARYGFAAIEEPGPRRGRSIDAAREQNAAKPRPMLQAGIDCENLYALLGLNATADEEQITAAYHKRLEEFQKTSGKRLDSAERIDLLNKAYSILNDPRSRAEYDRMTTPRAA